VQLFPETTLYREDLINILENLESLAVRQEQYESAILHSERIAELSLLIARDDPEDPGQKRKLALSYKELGILFEKAEKPELAQQQYSKSADFFRQILQDENVEAFMKDLLAMELREMATTSVHTNLPGLAKEYLILVRDYYEDLYEKYPEEEENWKAICEIRLLSGVLHESLGNYDAAVSMYESISPILNKQIKSDPQNLEYQAMLSVLYTQLGVAHYSAGEYEKSKDVFEKSLPISAKLLEEEPDNLLYMTGLVVKFTEYSKLLTSLGRKKEAKEYAVKANELKENLTKKYRPENF